MWRQPAKLPNFISLRGKRMNAGSAKLTYGQRLRGLVQIHPVFCSISVAHSGHRSTVPHGMRQPVPSTAPV